MRVARRQHQDEQTGQQNRHTPDDEAPTPAADQRHYERQRERDRQRLADQQAVGIDRGGETDAVRAPGAHQRRQRRLHDGDAGAHCDGGKIEGGDAVGGAARGRSKRRQHQSSDERRHRAGPRDQERTRYCGESEQQRRQRAERADLGLAHVQIGVNQRNDRRHGQYREAQAHAGKPQDRKRKQQFLGHGIGAARAVGEATGLNEPCGAVDPRQVSSCNAASAGGAFQLAANCRYAKA